VFVSYSRKDATFVGALGAALEARGHPAWIDQDDLPLSAEWWEEIRSAITGADAFVFVISPESVASAVCRREIAHASDLGKRIVPILLHDVDAGAAPETIASRNWITWSRYGDETAALDAVMATLDTDLEWTQAHTRLLRRATEWVNADRETSFLLRGRDLQDAEAQLTAAADVTRTPQVTPLQSEYVVASRRASARRLRIVLAAVGVALVVAVVLALVALTQRDRAVKNEHLARSDELTVLSSAQLTSHPALALGYAVAALANRSTDEAQAALRNAAFAQHLERTLEGYPSRVRSVAFDANGTRIVSAGQDGTARIWNLEHGGRPLVLSLSHMALFDAALDPSGRRLATAAADGDVRLTDIASQRSQTILRSAAGVHAVAFAPTDATLVAAADDGSVRLATLTGRGGVHVLERTGRPLWTAAFSPDGARVLAGGAGGTVRVWSVRRVTPVLDIRCGCGTVYGAAFSPDGRLIGTAGADGAIRLWEARHGRLVRTLRGHVGAAFSVAFDAAGQRLLSAGEDGTVRVFSTDGTAISVLRGHRGAVWSAAFDPAGGRVASGGDDGTVRVWDPQPPGHPRALPGAPGHVNGVAYDASGTRLVTAGADGAVRVWSGTGRPLEVLPGLGAQAYDAHFDVTGKRVVAAYGDGTVQVFSPGGTAAATVLTGSRGPVFTASFDHAGEKIVSAGEDAKVRVWDLRHPSRPLILTASSVPALYAAFDPAGRHVVASYEDGLVRVWDLDHPDAPRILRGHDGEVFTALFDATGRRVVTAGADGTVRVWDLSGGAAPVVLRGAAGPVYSATFDPSGERIASVGQDGLVRVWDWTLPGARDAPVTVIRFPGKGNIASFSPDGRSIVSGSDRGVTVASCTICRPITAIRDDATAQLDQVLTPDERALIRARGGPAL
jgi:WD40 repeat protein